MDSGSVAREILGGHQLAAHTAGSAELISGRTVLITGAGGSIGSELAQQVNSLLPQRLVLLDRDESLLQAVQLELHGNGLLDSDDVVLASIRDVDQLERVFDSVQPDIVFHAAALKHLPMLERQPHEAVLTNVLGTRNVLDAAVGSGTDVFVNVSTDKAADPTSVLGASKRVAEILTTAHAPAFARGCSVRFGNVLGSRGSFLPLLQNRMERGGPVQLTHPLISRFFMSIPEAAQLVITSATMDSRGDIFVLDMGTPILIRELIRRYASLVGVPEPEIVITGLRPGEKLEEVVVSLAEERIPTAHRRVWRTPTRGIPKDFAVNMLPFDNVYGLSEGEVLEVFARLVSDYQASSRTFDLRSVPAIGGVSV